MSTQAIIIFLVSGFFGFLTSRTFFDRLNVCRIMSKNHAKNTAQNQKWREECWAKLETLQGEHKALKQENLALVEKLRELEVIQ